MQLYTANIARRNQARFIFAEPDNWGYIFAIRTGSADFSHNVLATGWVLRGYKGVDGYLVSNGQRIAVPEEEDLFRLINEPYRSPELRGK